MRFLVGFLNKKLSFSTTQLINPARSALTVAFVCRRVWSGVAGTRGSVCRTRCASVTHVRRTPTAVCATTCVTGLPKSASTAGMAQRAHRSATAAAGIRTANASGKPRQLMARSTSSAGNVSARCDLDDSYGCPT